MPPLWNILRSKPPGANRIDDTFIVEHYVKDSQQGQIFVLMLPMGLIRFIIFITFIVRNLRPVFCDPAYVSYVPHMV
jgi:hypothetical protein